MKKIMWLPFVYLLLFGLFIGLVWSRLDDASIIAIAAVLAGGLAGVVGSFIGASVAIQGVERESEVRIKEYASSQALELTRLEIDIRRSEGKQKQMLAAAKIYREFYKALFELYETKTWPADVYELGLLNIYEFDGGEEVSE